jgi:HEAT repeat protein
MSRVAFVLASVVLAAPSAWAQTDAKKTATALVAEAERFEGEKKFDKAIAKAELALAKAGDNKDVTARALAVVGRSCEFLSPENIQKQQESFAKIVSDCGDHWLANGKPGVPGAKDKVAWKGVDVWIRQYYEALLKSRDDGRTVQTALSEIRAPESDPRIMDLRKKQGEIKTAVDEAKTALWGKIQPLDKEATAGLIAAGLGHKDEVVRGVAAEFLAEVIDEAGIATLVTKLQDDALRPGAGLALNRIFDEFATAARFDEEADKMEEDLKDIKPPSEQSQKLVDKNKERAAALRKKADEIRHGIPNSMDAATIQNALKDVLANDKQPAGQIEAAKALESVGRLSGALVEALVAGLASKNRNVRLACCVAAGSVDTTQNADKRKLADELIKIVTSKPEVDNAADSDFASEPAVRAAAATSLGRIGVIKAIPELIKALEDNSADVRSKAHAALVAITGKDLTFDDGGKPRTYESEPLVNDPGFINPDPKARKKEDEAAIRAKQVELRKKGVAAWTAWWTETEGIITLIERYWRFATAWKAGDPTRLFNKDEYLQETKARAYVFSDPAEAYARAERTVARFQQKKDFLQQDALDVGASALPKFVKFIGGELPDLEKGLTKELIARARASTRMFTAETVAKLLGSGGGDALSALRDMVGGGSSSDQKAGAALALGFMDKGAIGAQEREVLDKRGLADSDPVVRAAAARALKNVGDASNAGGLRTVATNNANDNEQAQIWALRALAAIKPKDPDVVKGLGQLVGDEGEVGTMSDKISTNGLVRELACEALSAIGEPGAITDLYLLRARRDLAQNVREAAQRAIREIGKSNASVGDHVVKVLQQAFKDDKGEPIPVRSNDRVGAALALGDLGQDKYAMAMVWRLVDENPPTLLKDQDPAVRAAVCRGLGTLGEAARIKEVGDKLIEAMATEAGSEQIRRDAYNALKAIAGQDVAPFDPSATGDMRQQALTELKSKFEGLKGGWKDAPR